MANFIMMIGLPGSGKSTFANTLSDAVIISSDEIRKELYGDEAVQDDPGKVFEIMRVRTLAALNEGQNVIYDATNLNRRRRVHILNQLPRDTHKHAYLMCVPVEVCLENNKRRERVVPDEVILQMMGRFQMPLKTEGFDLVTLVFNTKMPEEEVYFSELDFMPHDNPHHQRGVGEHIKAMVEAAKEEYPEDTFFQKLCKYHDIGKIFTKFVDENGIGHFYGHDAVGAYLTICITGDRKLAALVGEHMKLHNENTKIEKLERFFDEKDIELLRRLNEYDRAFN